MHIVERSFNLTEHLAPLLGHSTRSSGVHGSSIWNDLARLFDKKLANSITEQQLSDYGTIGFLWERLLEQALARLELAGHEGRYFRPGELTKDGIHLTPDYADLDFYGDHTHRLGLEEWKVTWRSINKADDLEQYFWKWLVQQKAYCYALDTRLARLRALFIVGNWRDQAFPQTRMWEFEFTDRELRDNWNMLVRHSKANPHLREDH